jgi:23S rRNA pseudouridine2604 synthase
MSAISLNKLIADSGYCSRREADVLITEGRVTVNDMLGTIGMRIMPDDVVAVDFEILKSHHKEEMILLAYHKPKGLTCTMDLLDRTSIMHFIKYQKRVFPIGRLDKDSEGLILLTNNGDIVNKILRSGNNHDKEYWVTLGKPYDKEFLKKMATGVNIDAGLTKPCKVKAISPRKFSVTLTQGLNRQIRKMCKALHAKVDTLQRVRIMNTYIGNLAPGKFRVLNSVEVNEILEMVKDSKKTADPKQRKQYVPKRIKPNGEFIPKGYGKEVVSAEYVSPDAVKAPPKERYKPKPVGRQKTREVITETKRFVPKSEIGNATSTKKASIKTRVTGKSSAVKSTPKSSTSNARKPKPNAKASDKPKNKAASDKVKEPAKKGSYKAYKDNKK